MINENIAKRIVDLMVEAATIIEIGPGKGILSKFLIQKFKNIFLIEIDKECVNYLVKENVPDHVKVINADFLKIDLNQFEKPINLIGSLPYSITSQIFFKILNSYFFINYCVFVVQLEVAKRLLAKPNTKNYGILSVLLQAYYVLKKHFIIHPNNFRPIPAVYSAVITLKRKEKVPEVNFSDFLKVVKCTFNKRRKLVYNNLKEIIPENLILDKYRKLRAENLTLEDYINLTLIYSKNGNKK